MKNPERKKLVHVASTMSFSEKPPFLEFEGQFEDNPELLDELVHDLKGREGSAINNSGLDAQIDYIRESLGDKEATEELARLAEEL